MTLRLGGDGAITGCTSLENPDLTVSGLTISGSFDAEKVLVASGTAAAPSYTFSGDTDNGLYYAGTDQVAVATNGTQRVLVNTGGNVGFGPSTSLGANVDVNASGTTSCIVRARNDTTTVYLDANNGFSYLNCFTNHPLLFGTNNTERLRITSGGLVGIGTSAPGGNSLLTVGGFYPSFSSTTYACAVNGTIPSSSTAEASAFLSNYSTQDSAVTYSSLAHYIAAQGTITGGSRLGVTNQIGFQVNNSLTGATNNFGFHSNIASGTGRWNFYAAGTASNYFAGSVGIGTAPQSQLHVSGSGDQTSTFQTTTSGADNRINFRNSSGTDAGGIWYLHNGNTLRFNTGGSNGEKARIDGSGRLLVGTSTALPATPGGAILTLSSSQAFGPQWQARGTSDDIYPIYYITERARGSNAVQNGDGLAQFSFRGYDGSQYLDAAFIHAFVDGTPGANDMPGRLVFSTTADGASSPAERMRIDNSGNVGIGVTNPAAGASGGSNRILNIASGTSSGVSHITFGDTNAVGKIEAVNGNGTIAINATTSVTIGTSGSSTPRMVITSGGAMEMGDPNTNGGWRVFVSDEGTAHQRGRMLFRAKSGAAGTQEILQIYNGTSEQLRITANGNITNANNSYGSISDVKLKENIVDANSQWADIKDLRVRNYNFIIGQTHTQIGLVAQEVELVSPGLVNESPDTDDDGNDVGTTTKSVNYSVLYMKAVKALQEAMERIETLEVEVAALKAQ